MRIQITAVVAASIAISLVVSAPLSAQTQSLADLAKKAEDTRKAAKKGAKVYTNADAGNVQAATMTTTPTDKGPTGAAASGATAQTPAADAAQDKGTPKDPAYWSERLKAARGQLERDIVFADAMQSRINGLTTDFVNRDDPAQRGVIEQDRNRALAELARLQKAIADGKKAIADLEEDARRAGMPAGVLR